MQERLEGRRLAVRNFRPSLYNLMSFAFYYIVMKSKIS